MTGADAQKVREMKISVYEKHLHKMMSISRYNITQLCQLSPYKDITSKLH